MTEDDGGDRLTPEEESAAVLFSAHAIVLRQLMRLLYAKGILTNAETASFLHKLADEFRDGADRAGTEATAYDLAATIEKLADEFL